MENTKFGLVLVGSLLFAGVFFYGASDAFTSSAVQTVQTADKHEHAANMSVAQQRSQERRPDGSYDTESHRWSDGDGCSRLDPNAANKNLDGVKPNTVGCTCAKRCVNGQTVEDTSTKDGKYVCRNACNKDRCFCPDPCKS